MSIRILVTYLFIFCLISCSSPEPVDLVIYNADIYTVNPKQPKAEALVISEGKIIMIGDDASVEDYKASAKEVIDAKKAFVMPGFIEGHGHFSGLGQSLINLNLLKTSDWSEIVDLVEGKVAEAKPGEWIIGRGWHQEKWKTKLEKDIHGYPFHDQLSEISSQNPVVLYHASGHALFANEVAMKLAGITKETASAAGGEIVRDENGEAIGVFEERAMSAISAGYAEYYETISDEEKNAIWQKGIDLATEECLKKGITSFQDAGSTYDDIDKYKARASDGTLDLRLWVMLRHSYESMKDNMGGLPLVDYGNSFFTCRAIKSELDGALGAFGAWLLKPYNDKSDFVGQNTTTVKEVSQISDIAVSKNMQLCVHAIGDRANRVTLDLFESRYDKSENKDLRWRIEHAQHLDEQDIPRFSEIGVIASVQAVHCTSDAPFVEKRLGTERARTGAYAWKSLLNSGARIANGTDAPVEDVDPIACYYASVTRKRQDNQMEFFTEQSMTRAEAIKSYTLDNAYAAFEENWKGSLEVGKVGDITILSNNLISCSDDEILTTKVNYTIVDGVIKYNAFSKK